MRARFRIFRWNSIQGFPEKDAGSFLYCLRERRNQSRNGSDGVGKQMAEMIVVLGGSGSGKSEFAEQLLSETKAEGNRYYLATMQVYDEDGRRKVERHRRLREGKGFLTIERPREIAGLWKPYTTEKMEENVCMLTAEDVVLLECMSNLTANEMFGEQLLSAKETAEKICRDIFGLKEQVGRLIIVTNNVFEDGMTYDEGTREYIQALADINRRLVEASDLAIEVVVGIPVVIKEK